MDKLIINGKSIPVKDAKFECIKTDDENNPNVRITIPKRSYSISLKTEITRDNFPQLITTQYESDAERVRTLLKVYNEFEYMSLDEKTLYEIEVTLRALTHYVTLIGFTKDKELGVVDIDKTVQELRNIIQQRRIKQ